MPYVDGQPGLPFSGRAPRARQNSYLAAVAARATRVTKRARYLEYLRAHGPATDQEAALALGYPLSTICSLRNHCLDEGAVEASGDRQGHYGRRVTVWAAR